MFNKFGTRVTPACLADRQVGIRPPYVTLIFYFTHTFNILDNNRIINDGINTLKLPLLCGNDYLLKLLFILRQLAVILTHNNIQKFRSGK